MSYATEHIVLTLKNTRAAKGLSQRALSELAGVPQSHISNIERGAVDLRLSSLVELARVLDLELTLVPRKSIPAVNSIVRSTGNAPREVSTMATKHLKRLQNNIAELLNEHPANTELAQFQRQIRDLQHLRISALDLDKLRAANRALVAFNDNHDSDRLRDALIEVENLRNAISQRTARAVPADTVRPAYSLEEDDHGE
jgi:transcriptional regulator with XRE-family HTH domain